MSTIDPSRVIFKDILDFPLSTELTGKEPIQIGSNRRIKLEDIAALAPVGGMITSTNPRLSYLANKIIVDTFITDLDSRVDKVFVSALINRVVIPSDGPGKPVHLKWSVKLDHLYGADGVSNLQEGYFECTVLHPVNNDNDHTFIPTGLQRFVQGESHVVVNWDELVRGLAPGQIWTNTQPEVMMIRSSQLVTVGNRPGGTQIPASQKLLTEALTIYNLNQWADNPDQVDTLSKAILLVDQNARQVGSQVAFHMTINFKPLEGIKPPTRKVHMVYRFIGPSVTPVEWQKLSNWESVTSVLVTETEYARLDPLMSNTYYQVLEDDQ